MAKEAKRKVKSKSSRKYTSSDDECDASSSDNEYIASSSDDDQHANKNNDKNVKTNVDNFKDMYKNAMLKLDEVMDQLSEKDKILERQEKLLILEKERTHKLEKIIAQEK